MKIFLFLCFISALCADAVGDLKIEVSDYLPEIQGWCSTEKSDSFIDLILETKPEVCVEIGVFAGASLLPAACALKHLGRGVLIAIDPWDIVECLRYFDPDQNANDIRWWSRVNMDHIYFSFLHTLRQFDLGKIVIVLKLTSKKAAAVVGTIDILHIDGGHSEATVLEDVLNYFPKVRQGGYIWLNDVAASQPAANFLRERCDLVKTVDGGKCILFRKRQ